MIGLIAAVALLQDSAIPYHCLVLSPPLPSVHYPGEELLCSHTTHRPSQLHHRPQVVLLCSDLFLILSLFLPTYLFFAAARGFTRYPLDTLDHEVPFGYLSVEGHFIPLLFLLAPGVVQS